MNIYTGSVVLTAPLSQNSKHIAPTFAN